MSEELLLHVDRHVDSAGGDGVDAVAQNLVSTGFDDMDQSFRDMISEAITFAQFGWSVMQPVYKYRRGDSTLPELRSKHNDGLAGWRNIQIRGQDSLLRWDFGNHGEIEGMWQRPPPSFKDTFLPMSRNLLFRTKAIKNNPEGRSWLRNGYRSWWFIKRLQEIEAIGIERNIAGYPDYQIPLEHFSDPTKLRDARQFVERIRADQYSGIVRPTETTPEGDSTGFKFSLVSSGGRQPGAFDGVIKRYESRLMISLLMEFMLLGLDKVGSFALSGDKTDLFAVALSSVLRRVEEVFNNVEIPRLMRYNGFPQAAAPRLRFGDFERESIVEYAQAVTQMVGAQVVKPDDSLEAHARRFLNLPQKGPVSDGQIQDATGAEMESDDGLGASPAMETMLGDAVPVNGEDTLAQVIQ